MYRSSVRHKHKQIAHLLISSVGPRPKSHHQQRIHPLPALSCLLSKSCPLLGQPCIFLWFPVDVTFLLCLSVQSS